MQERFSSKAAAAHVACLLSLHSINVDWTAKCRDECFAELATNSLLLIKIQTKEDYLTALHEIGHLVLKHNPSNWNEEAVCEQEAWDFAYKHSLYSVEEWRKRRHYKERIKADWESEEMRSD